MSAPFTNQLLCYARSSRCRNQFFISESLSIFIKPLVNLIIERYTKFKLLSASLSHLCLFVFGYFFVFCCFLNQQLTSIARSRLFPIVCDRKIACIDTELLWLPLLARCVDILFVFFATYSSVHYQQSESERERKTHFSCFVSSALAAASSAEDISSKRKKNVFRLFLFKFLSVCSVDSRREDANLKLSPAEKSSLDFYFSPSASFSSAFVAFNTKLKRREFRTCFFFP